jgi:2-dehydro-3-deoxyphosphogluconate aldolase / (4S)-4-hydroxy-2-oxoglutarate aldolase
MHDILKRIGDLGIVPTIKIENEADAVPVGRALLAANLPIAEITFRTGACAAALGRIARELPEILLGAGTVLRPEQVDEAAAAGARFIVAPGLNPRVVAHCQALSLPVIPGCATATDVENALGLGLKAVKFFPAEQMGGTATLKALSGPYPQMSFFPTGGIDSANLAAYLALPNVLACGGSWMVKEDLIRAGHFDEITRLTREAVANILGFGLQHIGVNMPDAASGEALAQGLAGLFGWPLDQKIGAVFAGSAFEVKQGGGPGQHGHIAIRTRDMRRALAHLKLRGAVFAPAPPPGPDGKPSPAVFLEGEWGGFALHLIEKV